MDTYSNIAHRERHFTTTDAPPRNVLGTFLARSYWIFITLFLIFQITLMFKISIFIHKSTERRRILTQLLNTPAHKRSDTILDVCYEYAATMEFGTKELWGHLDERMKLFTEQDRIGEDGEWNGERKGDGESERVDALRSIWKEGG
tara:strand:+ start:333 stop:770 length:438 start_codon:yes stop_codon:yes gene_type:complete